MTHCYTKRETAFYDTSFYAAVAMGQKAPDVRLSLRGVAQQFHPYLSGQKMKTLLILEITRFSLYIMVPINVKKNGNTAEFA